jgi:hypothetical protein
MGCAFSDFTVILSLGLHFKLEHENRKRDLLYRETIENVHVIDGGDKKNRFRYVT